MREMKQILVHRKGGREDGVGPGQEHLGEDFTGPSSAGQSVAQSWCVGLVYYLMKTWDEEEKDMGPTRAWGKEGMSAEGPLSLAHTWPSVHTCWMNEWTDGRAESRIGFLDFRAVDVWGLIDDSLL